MEREVHGVLGPLGVEEKLSREVADCLRKVEAEVLCGGSDRSRSASFSGSRSGSHSRDGTLVNGYGSVSNQANGDNKWFSWGKKNGAKQLGDGESGEMLKWSEDVGLTAFLLKFGEGMGMSSIIPSHSPLTLDL